MKQPKRPPMPLGVKFTACLVLLGLDPKLRLEVRITRALQLLGIDESEGVRWDHTPALGLREIRKDGKDWIPPANDPRRIQPLEDPTHKDKTFGRKGESRFSITGNGDVSRIRKVDRIVRKEAKRRAGLADPTGADEEAKRWKQPKRKIPSRPNPWPKGRKVRPGPRA